MDPSDRRLDARHVAQSIVKEGEAVPDRIVGRMVHVHRDTLNLLQTEPHPSFVPAHVVDTARNYPHGTLKIRSTDHVYPSRQPASLVQCHGAARVYRGSAEAHQDGAAWIEAG